MSKGTTVRCQCPHTAHPPRLVVLTGGPGAGKTAVLEIVRRNFCEHIAVLPEAASIIFGGGFWRKDTGPARRAAQRAIYHVQREMERLVMEERQSAVALCDRGTLDGLAYWPDSEDQFWREVGTNRETELARYSAVIQLRTPTAGGGYNHENPIRIESHIQASELDEKILQAWEGHTHRLIVETTADFLAKAKHAVDLIRDEVPDCCKKHMVGDFKEQPPLGDRHVELESIPDS